MIMSENDHRRRAFGGLGDADEQVEGIAVVMVDDENTKRLV